MGARQKLNSGYIGGSLLVAVFAGLGFDSAWVFLITATVLLALNLHSGDIRPGKGRW